MPHTVWLVRAGKVAIEGRCKATWQSEFKHPWREAGPPHHFDDNLDSEKWVVNEELSVAVDDLAAMAYAGVPCSEETAPPPRTTI